MYVPGVSIHTAWWSVLTPKYGAPEAPSVRDGKTVTYGENPVLELLPVSGPTLLQKYRNATPGEKYAMTNMIRGGIIGDEPTWGERFEWDFPFHGVPAVPLKLGVSFLGIMIDRSTAWHQNARRLSEEVGE